MSQGTLSTGVIAENVLKHVKKHAYEVFRDDDKPGRVTFLSQLMRIAMYRETEQKQQPVDESLNLMFETLMNRIGLLTSKRREESLAAAMAVFTRKLQDEVKIRKERNQKSANLPLAVFLDDVEQLKGVFGMEQSLLLVSLPDPIPFYKSELGREQVLYAVLVADSKLQDGDSIRCEARHKQDGTAMDTGNSSRSTECVSRTPTQLWDQHALDAMRTTSNANEATERRHESEERCKSATGNSEYVHLPTHKRRRLHLEQVDQEPATPATQNAIAAATQGQAGSAVGSGDTGNSLGPTAHVSQGPCQLCGHQPSSNLPPSDFCSIDGQKEATFGVDAATMRDDAAHSDYAVDEGGRQSRHPVSHDQLSTNDARVPNLVTDASNSHQSAGQSFFNKSSEDHQDHQGHNSTQLYASILTPRWTMVHGLKPLHHKEIKGTRDVMLTYQWNTMAAHNCYGMVLEDNEECTVYAVLPDEFQFQDLLNVTKRSSHWGNTGGISSVTIACPKYPENLFLCYLRCVILKADLPPSWPRLDSQIG
jgi:hypothetical protein